MSIEIWPSPLQFSQVFSILLPHMSGLKCDNCGKGIMVGHNVSHAKNRTRKIFKPNLHKVRILVGSNFKTMKLCTKCLRMLRKNSKVKTPVKSSEEVNQAVPLTA